MDRINYNNLNNPIYNCNPNYNPNFNPNYNYNNNYNNQHNPNILNEPISNNPIHRTLPSHLSLPPVNRVQNQFPVNVPFTSRPNYNYRSTGVNQVNGSLQNQVGYYPPPNQTNSVPRASGFGNTFVTPNSSSRGVKDDNNINDEDFSEKLIAYARFNRNTDLIKTILSEVMVPDVRQIVTTGRLGVLKQQVQALEDHHRKVDLEVKEMEKEYENKKRKFIESTNEYHADYKKLCRPAVGLQMYHRMVAKYHIYLKQNVEQQRWEETLAWAHQTAADTSPSPASVPHSSSTPLAEILGNGSTCAGCQAECQDQQRQ